MTGTTGIYVAVYEMNSTGKSALDSIEGVGAGYARIALTVPGFGQCASYIAEETHLDDALSPYDWYKELVLAGARFHGLPQAYVDAIESVAAAPDPDADRNAEMWTTVSSIKNSPADI